MAIPNRIDVGIPDNGNASDSAIRYDAPNPALAVAADKATPGMIDGDCCFSFLVSEDEDADVDVDVDENALLI